MNHIGKYAKIMRCPEHCMSLGDNGLIVLVLGAHENNDDNYSCETIGHYDIGPRYKCCLDFDDLEAYAMTIARREKEKQSTNNG